MIRLWLNRSLGVVIFIGFLIVVIPKQWTYKDMKKPIEVAEKPAEVAEKPAEVAEKPVEVAEKPIEGTA